MFVRKRWLLSAVMVCLGTNSINATLSADEKASIKAAFQPFLVECLKEFGISEDELKEMDKKDLDPCIGSCLFKKMGIFTDDGKYDVDKSIEMTKTYVKDEADLAVLTKIKEDCSRVNDEDVSDGDKGCERAKLLVECFMEHKEAVSLF